MAKVDVIGQKTAAEDEDHQLVTGVFEGADDGSLLRGHLLLAALLRCCPWLSVHRAGIDRITVITAVVEDAPSRHGGLLLLVMMLLVAGALAGAVHKAAAQISGRRGSARRILLITRLLDASWCSLLQDLSPSYIRHKRVAHWWITLGGHGVRKTHTHTFAGCREYHHDFSARRG